MCVTNFVKRNLKPQAVPASSAMISTKPSLISELLVANFMPLMMNAPRAEPSSALSSESQIPSVGPQCTLFTSSSAMVGPMEVKKSRPKRRRKPQKPGLTAKVGRITTFPVAAAHFFIIKVRLKFVFFALVPSTFFATLPLFRVV